MQRVFRAAQPIRSLTLSRTIRPFSAQASRMADDKNASSLDADKGSVGSTFHAEKGSVGQTAQQVGGPFDKKGAIGKEFTSGGSVGGTAQEAAKQASVFDKDGVIGKQFQPDGNIGQIGEAVGGPFSSQGAIGKQFTDKGAVGGSIQQNLGEGDKK